MTNAKTEEIRKALKELGVWDDFVRRRDEKRSDGSVGPSEARRIVLSEMASEGLVPNEVVELAVPYRRTNGAGNVEKRHVVASRSENSTVSKETFSGKRCSISSAFMWAYSNLSFDDVDPSEAPSAVAWQMLSDMRTSPSLKSEMLRCGLGAAMRKSEDESRSGDRFDGSGEYDLLGAIAEEGVG